MALLLLPAVFAERKPRLEPHGLIGVNVFRDPGFALPGAEVTLVPNLEPGAPPKMRKIKLKGIADSRGEYVFWVPVDPFRYTVRAAAKGYVPQEKSVSSQGEQRTDVTFTLVPESKR